MDLLRSASRRSNRKRKGEVSKVGREEDPKQTTYSFGRDFTLATSLGRRGCLVRCDSGVRVIDRHGLGKLFSEESDGN